MAPTLVEIDEGDDVSVDTAELPNDADWDCYEFHDGEQEEGERVIPQLRKPSKVGVPVQHKNKK